MSAKRKAVSGPGSFDHRSETRLVYAPGAVESLAALTEEYAKKGSKVLVVTDSGLVKAGHAAKVQGLLEAGGFVVSVFDKVQENPSSVDVDACKDHALEFGEVDLLIGLGGGSSLDTARGCNFLLSNGGVMEDYWGYGKAPKDMLPLLAIPTTAGTGSECQSFALISHRESHAKMACGDPKAAARVAVLDPTLTTTQPREVTANTGLDALVHALETAVTKPRNPLSSLYARESFRLIHGHLETVLEQPENIESRGKMQLGAAFAGLAIENSMLGAAHSAANPLTSEYNVIHGQAVAIMAPGIMRYNCEEPGAADAYAQLAKECLIAPGSASLAEACQALIDRVLQLIERAGLSLSLEAYGVEASKVEELARQAATQWTAQFNPRPIDEAAFRQLYLDSLSLA